jgi:cell division protein FtsB
MARALFAAPIHHAEVAAQIASLRARITELEAEVAQLRADRQIDDEFRQVAAAEAVELSPLLT